MAANYTDETDADFTTGNYSIAEGKKLSAAGMREALHTKENVANKITTIDSNSTDAQYPSAKAVYTGLAGKQDKITAGTSKNIVAYSGTAGTFDTLTRTTTISAGVVNASDDNIPTEKAVATALADKANASDVTGKADASALTTLETAIGGKQDIIAAGMADDILTKTTTAGTLGTLTKITSVDTTLDSDGKMKASDSKIPTERAVADALRIVRDNFLPVGTILAMSTSSWASASAEFRSKWRVCDSTNGTPDLRGKFLRGGTASDLPTSGADSVQLAKENLPKHAYTITDPKHEHTTPGLGNTDDTGGGPPLPYLVADEHKWSDGLPVSKELTGISVNDTFPSQTEYAKAFSIVPSYYTVIYIMKIA
jgi:hypothetical protein